MLLSQAIALRVGAALLIAHSLSAQTATRPARAFLEDSYTVTLQELQHDVPKKARIELEKAEKARRKNQLEIEIAHLKKAVEIDPENISARNNLGVCLMAIDPASAVAQWEEAIKVNPRKLVLFHNLSIGYFLIDDLTSSERAARTALDLDRTNNRARGVLGLVLFTQKQFSEETLAHLRSARDVYPMMDVYAGALLMNRGEHSKARNYFETYLSSGQVALREQASEMLRMIDHKGQRREAFPIGSGFQSKNGN